MIVASPPTISPQVCVFTRWVMSSQGTFSLNSAGVSLLSQLPGGQRRVFICTHISRQSSRTFYRLRSSTSDICSGNAPPLCPCRGCSLCHSTSSRSCHSHWKSCCIVWKKENAVSKCKLLQGFPNHCHVVLLGPTALQGTGWSQHSEHWANSPLHLQGWQGKPWAAITQPAVTPKITLNSCSDSQFGPGSIQAACQLVQAAPTWADKQSYWDTSTTRTNLSKKSGNTGRLQNCLKGAGRRWHPKEQTLVFVYHCLAWKGWRRNPTARQYLNRLHAKDPRLGKILNRLLQPLCSTDPVREITINTSWAGLCAFFPLIFSQQGMSSWAVGPKTPWVLTQE